MRYCAADLHTCILGKTSSYFKPMHNLNRAYMMNSETHGCCYSGAAAFDGGHLFALNSSAQWSQFNGYNVYFCAYHMHIHVLSHTCTLFHKLTHLTPSIRKRVCVCVCVCVCAQTHAEHTHNTHTHTHTRTHTHTHRDTHTHTHTYTHTYTHTHKHTTSV
jgi:hypothetical protein